MPLLSATDAAALVHVQPDRFLALVSEGFYPPPGGRDPQTPEWHAEELLAVCEAREHERFQRMTRDGLLADVQPVPTCKRVETAHSIGSAKGAGALSLRLAPYPAKAYRRTPGEYYVFVPVRRPAPVLAQLQRQFPDIEFAVQA